MLEISTCGAIPPYQNVLGGKLAALLLFSPQIADDYRGLYFVTASKLLQPQKFVSAKLNLCH